MLKNNNIIESDEIALFKFERTVIMIDFLQFVVLQDATVGSWLFALDAAVQEECSVGPGTAQQAEGCNGSGASLTKPRKKL